jgi:putative redox protein
MSSHSESEKPNAFRQVVQVNGFTLHVDVPKESGGAGGDPDPHDLFDSSLAACKALTALLYAKGHGIPLERVAIDVARDHSRERQGVYKLNVKVELFGPLTAEQKAKLHEITTRCPIHKLMTTSTVEIETAPLAG